MSTSYVADMLTTPFPAAGEQTVEMTDGIDRHFQASTDDWSVAMANNIMVAEEDAKADFVRLKETLQGPELREDLAKRMVDLTDAIIHLSAGFPGCDPTTGYGDVVTPGAPGPEAAPSMDTQDPVAMEMENVVVDKDPDAQPHFDLDEPDEIQTAL